MLLGLQSATKGRVSVNYVQEMHGNVFVQHVRRWNDGCRWQMMQSKALPSQEAWIEMYPLRALCDFNTGRSPRRGAWIEIVSVLFGIVGINVSLPA